MGAWHFWALSAGNLHAHKIPRSRGVFWGAGAGVWKCQFYLWARDFSEDWCPRQRCPNTPTLLTMVSTHLQHPGSEHSNQKPEIRNHRTFERKGRCLRVKRPFSEQLSEFQGILRATLRIAITSPLVAFKTQNRSVLAMPFPKSHPCPLW